MKDIEVERVEFKKLSATQRKVIESKDSQIELLTENTTRLEGEIEKLNKVIDRDRIHTEELKEEFEASKAALVTD